MKNQCNKPSCEQTATTPQHISSHDIGAIWHALINAKRVSGTERSLGKPGLSTRCVNRSVQKMVRCCNRGMQASWTKKRLNPSHAEECNRAGSNM